MSDNVWKVCSSCKSPIEYGQKYYVCSVSTCNTGRIRYYFDKVACWDAHVPMMRHRKAYAIEKKAPTKDEHEEALIEEARKEKEREERKRHDEEARAELATVAAEGLNEAPIEKLIVESRLKDYIADEADLRTSGRVVEPMSDHLRALTDAAIGRAIASERKTVMDRDYETPAGYASGDTLIVQSRLKNYIKARAGLNTSGGVMDVLSRHVRKIADAAIQSAQDKERQTVLDRDVPPIGWDDVEEPF